MVILAIAFAAMVAAYVSGYLQSRMETPQAANCIAPVAGPISATELAGPGPHWQCRSSAHDAGAEHMLVRFDLSVENAAQAPKYLRSRLGLFDRIELAVIDRDGTVRQSYATKDNVRLISGEPMFLVELPAIDLPH